MPPEQPPPSSPLARTGFDKEAPPERSRSALRALLGMPPHESGSRPAASLTHPSTGVRYAQSFLSAPEETGESAWELRKAEQPLDTTGTTAPRTVDRPPDMVTRNQADPTTGLSHAQPDTAPERTTIAIPGASTTRQDFRALFHTQNIPATSTTGTPQEETPEPVQQSTVPSSSSRTPRPAIPDPELLTRLERLVTEAEAKQKSEAQTARETDRATQRQGAATGGPAAGHLSSPRPSSPLSSPRPSSPFAQASASGVQRATKDLANQLEQLRRTVRELATRMSSQEARIHDDPQRQQRDRTVPQPVPRVVVVKRPALSPRTPHAFWERRYLGRGYMRPLR